MTPDLEQFDPRGMVQIPGSTMWTDRPVKPCGCCGATTWAVVRVRRTIKVDDVKQSRDFFEIVCPRCPLLTMQRVDKVWFLGTCGSDREELDLLSEPVPAKAGELEQYLTQPKPFRIAS